MGKGESPTSTELEFVYGLFANGYGDVDVLSEYERRDNHGELGTMPYRHDIRFVRQRRREYEAARRVPEKNTRRASVPDYVAKHWEDLAGCAAEMDRIWVQFLAGSNRSEGHILDTETAAFEEWALGFGYLAQRLLEHVKTEFPTELGDINGWQGLLRYPPLRMD